MQGAGLADLFQFLAKTRHARADHAPVRLDLRLARPAEEAKAAALAFEVSPAAHQAALLVVEMREFDLQATFSRGCSLAEDFEDQPGAVDHLALERFFEIALLDRAQGPIHHQQFNLVLLAFGGDILDLTGSEQRVRLHVAHWQDDAFRNHDTDRQRQALRFFEARFRVEIAGLVANVRHHDERAGSARHFAHQVIIEAQSASSSSSSVRSTEVAGWIVETACL